MTTGEHRHLNIARIVWESARNLAGWSSTSQVADEAGKVIPYYPTKCCADVLRNLKQRGLILHKPATPGANTAGQKGCSRWRVDPVMPEPEWRQADGKRDPKNKGKSTRRTNMTPRMGVGKIALEEIWPASIHLPKQATPSYVHKFMDDREEYEINKSAMLGG